MAQYGWHNLIEMEYYVLTNLGKQMILQLIKEKRDDEANILGFLLRAEAATIEQIAKAIRQDEAMLYYKLRSFSENRWVRRQTKAAGQF